MIGARHSRPVSACRPFCIFQMKNLTKSIIENNHWSKSNILMHEIKALANVPEPKNLRSSLNFG
jgi:hypothetical protein